MDDKTESVSEENKDDSANVSLESGNTSISAHEISALTLSDTQIEAESNNDNTNAVSCTSSEEGNDLLKSRSNPSKKSSQSSLYVESEQRLAPEGEERDALVPAPPPERPTSAGRQRTPPQLPSDVASPAEPELREVINTRNLVAFDAHLKGAYPERTDSETELIIQQLRETLATPPPITDEDLQKTQTGSETFSTSIPEEEMDEARRRQQRRKLEQEVRMYDPDNPPVRLTMQQVIDEKVLEHYNRGIAQANQGQFEAAVTSFSKAINLQPCDVSCYIERAEAYMQMCDFRSAHLNYKKAYALEPHNPHIFDKLAFICYLEGQCLFDQCLYAEALECFTRATEMKPSASGYHTRAITCLASLGRNQECLALVTRRLEAETTGNPELYVLRARLHLLFQNTTLCYYDVRDALSLDSEQPQAVQLMKEIQEKAENSKQHAMSLTIQGKLQEALNKITTAVETDPSKSEYHVLRGALYRRLQNFNTAIDDYLLAMDKADHNEQDPVYQGAQRQLLLTYNDFAVHCYQRGFYEEAVILLNKAIKGEKNEKGLYINRGDCFFKLNELGFALADYQQGLEIDPGSWEIKCRVAVVHNEFGITAYQERQYQEALDRFSSAIEHNGKVGQFYVHRARSYYMMQDVDASRKDILISLHLDPNNEEIIPLVSRLFPGRSVNEVLKSKAAEIAREQIAVMVGSRHKLPPVVSKAESRRKSRNSARSAKTGALATGSDVMAADNVAEQNDRLTTAETRTPGARRMPTDEEIIREKKSVTEDLKTIFRFPNSLQYTGPRITSNPRPKPLNNGQQGTFSAANQER
ncbi:tetratricopeptide repeat protein 16-like isoform X2 [Clavelina lepadiformis]|uniref:tetratricopeptide repeat protein 16-like isoform X2 n=1 Tax=Clavelina lepadiformis TaxID=159417 RepID=UPI0040438388